MVHRLTARKKCWDEAFGKFVEALAHLVFRYRFRRLRKSDGLCVVHLPVPRVTNVLF